MPQPVFEFIGDNHPFASDVARLREIVCKDPDVATAVTKFRGVTPTIHSEIKIDRSAGDAAPQLARFYWSLQFNRPGDAFFAKTLTFDRKSPDPVWQTFPNDSYLPGLASYLKCPDGGDVLRYVPLRRFTFKERTRGAGRIGKFKRRSRFQEGYNRLKLSAELLRTTRTFRVARPAGISPEHALYYQDMLEGENVAELVDAMTAQDLLYEIGRLHRQIHAVDGSELALRHNRDFLQVALGDLDLIIFHMPYLQPELGAVAGLLRQTEPDDSLNCFCHGDFVCSQILKSGANFSIIDFDLCCRADPLREVAMFEASLPYDVPALQPDAGLDEARRKLLDSAAIAYSEGYGISASQRRRLLWHKLCAELYYLALMLKKDRFQDATARYRMAQVARFSGELG